MELAQQQRIEDTTKRIVCEIDAEYLRKMQVRVLDCCFTGHNLLEAVMHRCAARCCEDTSSSMETVNRCIQNCSVPLTEAQNFVQEEFSNSQRRLHRCIMDCNDSIKDKMGASPSESEAQKYNADFENCAVKCVDKHVEQLPALLKRMKDVLSKKQQQSAFYYPS